jgi:putative FmdB family regulatory protein
VPVYDYVCEGCGPFTALRPMAEFQAPHPCAECGEPARRAILTAPALSAMDGGRRNAHATNERSANVPTRAKRHPASCGCCKGGGRKAEAVGGPAAAKSFPAARPWMISH